MQYDLLLVDGPYLAHKSYHAPFKLTTSNGKDATMIQTFIRSLNAVYKQFKPKEVIVAWESHGTPSWRREMYPTYKPGKPADIQFVSQLKDIQILLYLFGLTQYTADNNEADDVIATLAACKDKVSLIYTVDKDIMQMICNNCYIYNDKTKQVFDSVAVKEKFLVSPKLIPDLLAIMGDKADNIQGLNGYGNKKAVKVLEKYGNIESIPDDEFDLQTKKMLLKNKKLTLLNTNCSLRKASYNGEETIESILDKYELKKMKESIKKYEIANIKNSIR